MATRVIGTGLLVNFGMEACLERGGRSDLDDPGRLICSGLGGVLSGSLIDPGLLDATDGGLPDAAALGTGVLGCSVLVSSGADVVASVSVSQGILASRSGILICFSPVDFLDGGGPLKESP